MDIFISLVELQLGQIVSPGTDQCDAVRDEQGVVHTQCAGRVLRRATREEFLKQFDSQTLNGTTWNAAHHPDARFYQIAFD